jgi:RalA-binding protein 1
VPLIFLEKRDVVAQAAPVARPVFGVPLQEAVAVARIREGFELPAVIYRCVEYLEGKNAEMEEGIYRLSGSSNVIKALKEKFNMGACWRIVVSFSVCFLMRRVCACVEGDVNLLASNEYYDPHAVAGLLKTFLRELPVHILTRELQPSFMQVVDLKERRDRINELGTLVTQLPIANYTLLRFLTAHLIHIVQNEKVNKMTLRNVGIVFSPTLAVPATLFSLFLTEFDALFAMDHDQPAPLRIDEHHQLRPAGLSAERLSAQQRELRRKSRNSMLYTGVGADKLLENEGHQLGSACYR